MFVTLRAHQNKLAYFPATSGPPPAQDAPAAHAAAASAAAAAAPAAAAAGAAAAEEVADVLSGRGREEAVDERIGCRVEGRQALEGGQFNHVVT